MAESNKSDKKTGRASRFFVKARGSRSLAGQGGLRGFAWECGYAYALGKKIVAVHLHEGKSNCMINCSCRANVRGMDRLRAYDFSVCPPANYYE